MMNSINNSFTPASSFTKASTFVTSKKEEKSSNTDKKSSAKANQADSQQALAGIQNDREKLTDDATKSYEIYQGGTLDLNKGMADIQQLSLPEMNNALGLRSTSVGGANDEEAGDPELNKQVFSQMFAGGEKGDDLLKNFAGLAVTVTGKSKEEVDAAMGDAKEKFRDSKANLGEAAGFIGEALGIDGKVIGLLVTAYALLTNPFTMAGAAALFTQAMDLMNESKGKKTEAKKKQETAATKKEQAQEKVEKSQDTIERTAALQAKIKEVMEKLKNNQVLTKEQLAKLVKAKEESLNKKLPDYSGVMKSKGIDFRRSDIRSQQSFEVPKTVLSQVDFNQPRTVIEENPSAGKAKTTIVEKPSVENTAIPTYTIPSTVYKPFNFDSTSSSPPPKVW